MSRTLPARAALAATKAACVSAVQQTVAGRLGIPLQLVRQRLEDVGGGRHKTAANINYAKEPLQLLHCCGLSVLQDGGDAAGNRRHPCGVHMMSRALYLLDAEDAFLLVDYQPCRLEPLEQDPQMLQMLLQGAAADNNVI
jgi:hypothetical protein